MDVTCLLLVLAVLVLLVVAFVRYMSATHDTFKKLGVDTPPTSRLMGNLGAAFKLGVFKVQQEYYNMFRDKKVYGWYEARKPVMIVKDLDLIRDVLVKNFNCFVDRRQLINPEPPLSDNMLNLTGDHWKRVRSTVSPTFSSARLKRMSPHVNRNVQKLMECILEKSEKNENIELKEMCGRFTLDVIASTAFGMDTNILKDPDNIFATMAKKITQPPALKVLLAVLLPSLRRFLTALGLPVTLKNDLRFFSKIIDKAMIERKEDGQAGKVNDFLDLLIDAQNESGLAEKGSLTTSEIHGQALVFIFAGFDTVSTVLSFTLFLLTVHPECLERVQREIDQQIGKDSPNYDNVQSLSYLDMCINEAIRMFPPGFFLDRKCTEDVDIQGIHFPKDMAVMVPVYAIHHDPEIWPEPEKFQPERFSPENKETRHPYAHLPFGQGPRNCIGMRLALLELKMALASILQKFTPVRCDKTVYPVELTKMFPTAKDGLWVKMEPRNK